MPGLARCSRDALKSSPIRLDTDQAIHLRDQMMQTATVRDWRILAMAVMSNHIHVVVGVPGDPDPVRILGDVQILREPRSERAMGTAARRSLVDTRRLDAEVARRIGSLAIAYVRNQPYPLTIWLDPDFVEE